MYYNTTQKLLNSRRERQEAVREPKGFSFSFSSSPSPTLVCVHGRIVFGLYIMHLLMYAAAAAAASCVLFIQVVVIIRTCEKEKPKKGGGIFNCPIEGSGGLNFTIRLFQLTISNERNPRNPPLR